jgi:hypothetical protein
MRVDVRANRVQRDANMSCARQQREGDLGRLVGRPASAMR